MESLEDPETESLTNSLKHQVKYGSTGNHVSKERFITHVVQPTDTLQGLALRYQVTMEQIKRANKLWSSDNLTLRSKNILSIPLPFDSQMPSPIYSLSTESSGAASPTKQIKSTTSQANASSTGQTSSLDSDEICLDEDSEGQDQVDVSLQPPNKLLQNGFKNSLLTSHANDIENRWQVDDESASDFLIRIDSSIAKTKDKVKHMQQHKMSTTHSDDDLFRYNHSSHPYGLKRNNSSSSTRSNNSHCSLHDFRSSDQPFVMTRSRKVKTSLKRLEKAQDELFEL